MSADSDEPIEISAERIDVSGKSSEFSGEVQIKFRDGTEKNFLSPITTKPWGTCIPKLAEVEAPTEGQRDSQHLYSEPHYIRMDQGEVHTLKAAGLKASDIDYWEINEAFAVVALYAIRELGLDPDRVNVKGGGIAIGHPLGATGGRLVGTLARILREKGGRYGCATMCCGGGQGVAMIIEQVQHPMPGPIEDPGRSISRGE